MDTVITSREFNQDVSAAKRAAEGGPVTITDHGRRSHVLLSAAQFDRLTGSDELVGDRLWARGTENLELELQARGVEAAREFDL